jgi:hypothetical protein
MSEEVQREQYIESVMRCLVELRPHTAILLGADSNFPGYVLSDTRLSLSSVQWSLQKLEGRNMGTAPARQKNRPKRYKFCLKRGERTKDLSLLAFFCLKLPAYRNLTICDCNSRYGFKFLLDGIHPQIHGKILDIYGYRYD